MKKININFRIFTFRFSDCISILNRNVSISILYYTLLVFILSFMYHFTLLSYMSYAYAFIQFLKSFIIELCFSTIFYLSLILCMYSLFNIKINTPSKNIKLTFHSFINLFSHLYTIPFLLDMLFLIILKDKNLNANFQTYYSLLSIAVSILVNIVYPIIFINYIYKKNIKVSSKSSNLKCKYNVFKNTNFLNKIILLDHEYILNKTSCTKIINLLISFFICCFLLSYISMCLNPNIIYMDFSSMFASFNAKEIIFNFLNFSIILFTCMLLITIIYTFILKLKNIKNDFLINLKIILYSPYISFYIYLVYLLERKINTFSMIKPTLLPTQMVSILIPPLYIFILVFLVFVLIKTILYKYYKKNKL